MEQDKGKHLMFMVENRFETTYNEVTEYEDLMRSGSLENRTHEATHRKFHIVCYQGYRDH